MADVMSIDCNIEVVQPQVCIFGAIRSELVNVPSDGIGELEGKIFRQAVVIHQNVPARDGNIFARIISEMVSRVAL